jgi:hypothetical protein
VRKRSGEEDTKVRGTKTEVGGEGSGLMGSEGAVDDKCNHPRLVPWCR